MKLNRQVIEGFVGSVLSSRFDGKAESADFHKECWELCTGPDRFVAIAAPRGHAKSSAITLGYGLATLLFRERKFMLLVSDTESQAVQFLSLFKSELQENQDLIDLFGLKRDEKGLVKFQKDSEADIIVEFEDGHKFRIIAKGSEQKLRGLIWNGTRPDIIMCDDIENDELVMNKERRDKMRRWFKNALLPCRADHGIVRMVGTVLHMDSLLESFMPNMSDKYTIVEPLRTYSTRKTMWKSIKYRAHTDDFSELLWPSKKSKAEFQMLLDEARRDGMLDGYSQEYLNIPLDESTSFFRRQDFIPMSKADKDSLKNIYITADLAISEKETADYSVFIIGGMDEHRNLHIIDIVRDRLDGREIVDTILFLEKAYKPVAFGVEEMQVSKAIGPFLHEEMIKYNVFPNIIKLKTGNKDKMFRARSIQARMRAHGVKFDKDADWYPKFEDELLTFPRNRHDDQVDSFAYLGLILEMLVEAPSLDEQDEDAYQEELAESGMNFQGRSSVTGY